MTRHSPSPANDPGIGMGHLDLIRIADRLRGLRDCRDHEKIGEILGELADACLERFGLEEVRMMGSRYPDADKHVQDHNVFFADFTKIAFLYETGDIDLTDDILGTLTRWRAWHGQREDSRLARHLEAHAA